MKHYVIDKNTPRGCP